MIIGIGETVFDIIFKNDTVQAAVPGGSTFNAVVSVGRTNTPSMMVTETGDDHVGDIVTDFLRQNNVDTQYVFRHAGTQSHVSLAFLNERNDAQYSFYKHHGALALPTEMPEFQKGDIVIFGSFYAINPVIRDYTRTFFTKAKAAGAVLYYDINFRAPHVKDLPHTLDSLLENISLATVVRGSAEDFQILFGLDNAEEVYLKHIAPRCPLFIYTNADKPVELFTPTKHLLFPAKKIETVSTIGAGDNFNAGFCYALNNSRFSTSEDLLTASDSDWAELISTGQAFSAEVCQSLSNNISVEFAENLGKGGCPLFPSDWFARNMAAVPL